MASYDASINVRVTGTGMVDGVLNRVQELERLVRDINTRPLDLSRVAGRGDLADRFGAAARELNGLKNSFINTERAVEAFGTTTNRTIANTTSLATTFKRVADNSDIASAQFREFTVAAQQAAVAANTLGRTRLATLAEELSFGGAGGRTIGGGSLVQELLRQESTIPNSIAALSAYQAELNDLRQLVDVTSNEFRDLDIAMSRIQQRMDLAEGRGPAQGPQAAPRPGAGAGAAGRMFENLALGVGFPLLFGGGIGEVIGGGLGSFVGTGFGGQILGSAIGKLIQEFNKQLSELGTSLQKPIENFKALKDQNLLASKAQESYIERLIENQEYTKAAEELQKELNKTIGSDNVESLKRLADANDQASRSWAQLNLSIQVALAGPLTDLIGYFDKLAQYANLPRRLQTIESQLPEQARGEFQKSLEDLQALRLRPMFAGGIGEGEYVKRAQELAAKYEPQMVKAAGQLTTEEELKQNQKLREEFIERVKVQTEAYALTSKLTGTMLTDNYKLLDIEKQLKINNEERYALLQQQRDLEARGGIAAGYGTEINKIKTQLQELANTKLELEIQAKEESLRVFEQQIKTAAERATRALDLQAGALQGQTTVYQSRLGLEKASNDLYLQRLSMEEEFLNKQFEQTGNLNEQLAILDRLAQIVEIRFKLNIANAKIERDGAIAQLKLGNALLQIELKKQQIQYKTLVAVMEEARAKGLLNQAYIDAVDAQYDAVLLAEQALNFGIENAKVQEKIANAMYDQQVESAAYARNLELAELATRRTDAINGANRSTSGFQLGQTWTGPSFVVQLPTATALTPMAVGGYVTRPTPALIGEGGQGEYVVPESRAASFAMNYLMGARGAGAVDGDATIPAINITTGPVMQQGGQNYVTIQDMEAGLQAVADTILNNSRSYSSRRFTGVT